MTYGYYHLKTYFTQPRRHFIAPIRYKTSGVTIHNREKIMPGVTLLTSFWQETDWTAGIRLIDLEGKILHHWEVRAENIWPESPYDDLAKNTKNTIENYAHGTYLYPNGDIIINIEFMGLVRINSKGDVLWKLPYRTHHSVFRDEEGNLWVPGAKWIESGNDRIKLFPGLQEPFVEEAIVKVSPEGIILKEISLLESLYKGNYQHLLHNYNRLSGDLLHLNDVEVLSSKLAEQFPIFKKGDLVVSFRNLSIIAVLEQSGKIKWLNTGLCTRQHDPDFEEDGQITVFDNRVNVSRSMIIKINPVTNEINTLYPTFSNQAFYTATGGNHQKLDNGNRIITEVNAGRVFEITPAGETVWEWIQQPYDEKYVPEVHEGTRYNFEEKDIANWEKANSNFN
ncbi:arylsulfotransferase family protein [Candidatus Neomarinimicrobiota bacterium]